MGLLQLLFRKKENVMNVDVVDEDKTTPKIYQLTKDYVVPHSGYKYPAGKIFVQWKSPVNSELKTWLLATPTDSRQGPYMDYLLLQMKKANVLKQIQIDDILKLKPHWHKEFKAALQHYTKSITQNV